MNINEKGWKYLLLSFLAFAGLGLELVIVMTLSSLIGQQVGFHSPPMHLIIHWILTCITWLGVAWLLLYNAKKRYGFDAFTAKMYIKGWQWIVVFVLFIVSFLMSFNNWGGFKPILELKANGLLLFIFQYIYYIVETILVLLIIVFGQKAFDMWTKKPIIPWGGLVCALTWGAVHIISRGVFDINNALFSSLVSLMFGTVYLLVNKDIKIAYIVILLMFIL